MTSSLFLFEDSSQCHFGGGQRVTLDVLKVVKDDFQSILIFDFKKSLFIDKAIDLVGHKARFISLLKMTRSNFFYSYIYNFFIVFFYLLIFSCHSKINSYVSVKTGVLFVPVLKVFSRKCIYHAHNVEQHSSFLYKIFYSLFHFFNEVICVSNSVRISLLKCSSRLSNLIVIYNSIQLSSIDNRYKFKQVNSELLKVVFVGSLQKIKGVDIVLTAFNSGLLSDNVRLDIYGDGPEKDCLVKQSKQDSRIRFKGFIDNIYEVLNQYDVLVLPTRIPEACPMVLIEAMCLGVPVLVSNIGGQFELLSMSKFGMSFESEDHVDFSNKLNLFHSMQFISCLHEASDLEHFVDKVNYNSFSILIRKVICE